MNDTAPRTWSATYAPEPWSVREARSFVCDRFSELGYAKLAETAALAVSELTTNVVLHARSPFTVLVTELDEGGVRVSVQDDSPSLPHLQPRRPTNAIGRGLQLVARLADAWGTQRLTEAEGRSGKEVWFDLGLGLSPSFASEADFDPTALDLLTSPHVPRDALVDVRLLNLPLRLFAREQVRNAELMREMALIAFANPAESDVPAAITALASELEQYRGVGAATDAARDAAIRRGDATMDLVYRLPRAVGPACARLNELLDLADDFCRSENLLTLEASEAGTRLRRWYLGEVAGQVAGKPPIPWDGPLE